MNFDYLISGLVYFLAGAGITYAIYQYLKFRELKKEKVGLENELDQITDKILEQKGIIKNEKA